MKQTIKFSRVRVTGHPDNRGQENPAYYGLGAAYRLYTRGAMVTRKGSK